MQVAIAGAGNFGREVAAWLWKSGSIPHVGFIDDETPGCRRTDEYVRKPDEFVVVAVAEPAGRESVVKRLRARGAVFRGLELQHTIVSR
jgi:Trk K+ transport system NAD-binding subunit